MRFDGQPVNLEAERGSDAALKVQVRLAELPPGATNYQVWAARLPEALSIATLTNLATGALSLDDVAARTQESAWAGLRPLRGVGSSASLGGAVLALEGKLFEDALDMALAWDQASSMETTFDPAKDRSDQCWYLAATALDASSNPVIAMGGLNQWQGQEHLAAVWLSPSNFSALVLLGDWLVSTIRSFKPLLDWRVAQTCPEGSNWSVGDIRFTDMEQSDALIAIFVTPRRAAENPLGIAAPDRREQVPVFNIRTVCFADSAVDRRRTLTVIADSLGALLNTRALREFSLPNGDLVNLAFVSDTAFGTVQPTLEDAVDVTWSCKLTKVGMF